MARVGHLSSVLAIVTALTSAPAHAQDASKVGITMGYPAAVGIVWQASEKVAIRPAISFVRSNSTSTSISSGSNTWNLGTSVAALAYLKKYDNVRTYFSPSYHYSRTSLTITPPSSSASPVGPIKTTSNSNGGAAAFGAEYAPSSHIRIYGEVGITFTHLTQSASSTNLLNASANAWGTTAGVGFVFYP